MDPWRVELVLTTTGRVDDAERRAASRDVERGRLHRVRRGVQVAAAVLHGLPTVGRRLDRVHVLVADDRLRGVSGTCARVLPLRAEEVVTIGGLLATGPARTAIDLADAGPAVGGIMAADALLAGGLPRELLEQAVDLAGPRKEQRCIGDVVAFAHPGAESAADSQNRWSRYRLELAPHR